MGARLRQPLQGLDYRLVAALAVVIAAISRHLSDLLILSRSFPKLACSARTAAHPEPATAGNAETTIDPCDTGVAEPHKSSLRLLRLGSIISRARYSQQTQHLKKPVWNSHTNPFCRISLKERCRSTRRHSPDTTSPSSRCRSRSSTLPRQRRSAGSTRKTGSAPARPSCPATASRR